MRRTSLPSRGAWIEMWGIVEAQAHPWSLPSRGAWIEITLMPSRRSPSWVAPLAGSVDRNMSEEDNGYSRDGGRSPRGERG